MLCLIIEPDFKLLLSWLAGEVGWFFPGVEYSPYAWMFRIGGGCSCVVVSVSKFSIGAQCDGLSALMALVRAASLVMSAASAAASPALRLLWYRR